MKVNAGQAQIQQSNQEMFQVIQQAQQQSQKMANKMIRLSLEQKITHGKEVVTDNLIDLYL